MDLKDIVVSVFSALAVDEELLNLLEVPSSSLKDIREQILEDRYPNDLILNNLSRLCIFETPSSKTMNPNVERGWIEIDIYVTKEKNRLDRRIQLIAQRVIEIIDSEKRRLAGKPPIPIGVNLSYYNRLPNMFTDNEEWIKYGVVFNYDYIRI